LKISRLWKYSSLRGKKEKAIKELKINLIQADPNLEGYYYEHRKINHELTQNRLIR